MRVFILTDNHNLETVKRGLYNTLKTLDLSKPKRITIDDDKESKTSEQRSWFHILCGLFGSEIGYTKVQMKRVMLKIVFGTEVVLGVEIEKSSESLKRADYSQLIEQTYIEAGGMGIQLPPPSREM